jgi:hypothetical protein
VTVAHWLVTCSCGWGRECISEWAAQSVSRLHQQVAEVGAEHTTQIGSLDNLKDGGQLPRDNGSVWLGCSCGGLIMQPEGERAKAAPAAT